MFCSKEKIQKAQLKRGLARGFYAELAKFVVGENPVMMKNVVPVPSGRRYWIQRNEAIPRMDAMPIAAADVYSTFEIKMAE